jgi:hypothetical protein
MDLEEYIKSTKACSTDSNQFHVLLQQVSAPVTDSKIGDIVPQLKILWILSNYMFKMAISPQGLKAGPVHGYM